MIRPTVSLEEIQTLNDEILRFNKLIGSPKSKYLKLVYINHSNIKYSKFKFKNISSRRVKKYHKKLKEAYKIAISTSSFKYI